MAPTADSSPQLPVLAILREALTLPFTHLRALIRLGWPLALAYAFTYALPTLLIPSPASFQAAPRTSFHWWFLLLVPLDLAIAALSVSFSVAWMRLMLGMPAAAIKLGFGRREFKYAGLTLGLLLGPALVFFLLIALLLVLLEIIFGKSPAAGAPHGHLAIALFAILSIAAFVSSFFVWFRLILFAPAVAIDQYRGLRAHWCQTADHFWRIVLIVLALFLIAALAQTLIAIAGRWDLTLLRATVLILAALSMLFAAFYSTALALIYRRLVLDPAAPTPAALQA